MVLFAFGLASSLTSFRTYDVSGTQDEAVREACLRVAASAKAGGQRVDKKSTKGNAVARVLFIA
jgi:hypothetical protein